MKRIFTLLTVILAILLLAGTSLAGNPMTGSRDYSADQLIGLNVVDKNGDHIGFIRNVKMNSDTNEILYVTVATSLVGIGEAEHAVPLEALKIRRYEGKATLIVSEDKLQSAPIIVEGESEDVFRGGLYEHYGIAPPFGEGMEESGKMMEEEKEGYKGKSAY